MTRTRRSARTSTRSRSGRRRRFGVRPAYGMNWPGLDAAGTGRRPAATSGGLVPGAVADLEELFAADELGRAHSHGEEKQNKGQYDDR